MLLRHWLIAPILRNCKKVFANYTNWLAIKDLLALMQKRFDVGENGTRRGNKAQKITNVVDR